MHWTSELAGDTRFIGIRENVIYIANPGNGTCNSSLVTSKGWTVRF